MDSRTAHSETSVPQEIVRAAAAARGVDPLDLEPLYDAVDPDAVEALVESGFTGRIEFRYAGCAVVVRGDGHVHASVDRGRRDGPAAPPNEDAE